MRLGIFSLSLAVKDLTVSKTFYEKLGFQVIAGGMDLNFLVLKNEETIIGLFQGMFENNILTFNPGWDSNGQAIEDFDDIRVIQKELKNSGIEFDTEADENTEGRASFMIKDPDGNVILVDQHV